jgi:hypothetical protein
MEATGVLSSAMTRLDLWFQRVSLYYVVNRLQMDRCGWSGDSHPEEQDCDMDERGAVRVKNVVRMT